MRATLLLVKSSSITRRANALFASDMEVCSFRLTLLAQGLRADPQPPVQAHTPAYLPSEYVPVHALSKEPSVLNFPEQVPEPLMPLYFLVPLRIFHLIGAGFVMSVEADPSY